MKKIKYLSLFSGIGGFEYGLQNSQYEFECIGFSEVDKYAKSIYIRHFPEHTDLGDATEINPKELPNFDLLVGGFPCQAFSISGKREGFNDCRGTLFFEIARICAEKKPRYLLLENVKGLLSHDAGRTYKKMLRILSELGYDVEWQVYNSKSVGGVPQNRERLYIKGYFREKCGGEILSQKRDCRETGVQIIRHYFNRQVRKRVHDVDYGELCDFLRSHKDKSGLSLNEISSYLNKPFTEVGHWFRNDEYFSPPTDDIWYQLKDLIGIESDKYDRFITEFEWVDGVFEQNKRADDINGASSTLTTRNESLIVDPDKIKVVGNTSNTNHNRNNVLDSSGLSTTLTASNYKHPITIMDDYEDPKLKKVGNVFKGGGQAGIVYDANGISTTLCANGGGTGGKTGLYKVDDGSSLKLKNNTNKGYDEVTCGDGVRLCHPSSKLARGRTQKEKVGTLSTSNDWGVVDRDYRIRRLTPRECERLQAFPDDYTKWGKDDELISDTQRYKCLGNAVTTTVVTYVVNGMFDGIL